VLFLADVFRAGDFLAVRFLADVSLREDVVAEDFLRDDNVVGDALAFCLRLRARAVPPTAAPSAAAPVAASRGFSLKALVTFFAPVPIADAAPPTFFAPDFAPDPTAEAAPPTFFAPDFAPEPAPDPTAEAAPPTLSTMVEIASLAWLMLGARVMRSLLRA
jgi:hypothetical protein